MHYFLLYHYYTYYGFSHTIQLYHIQVNPIMPVAIISNYSHYGNYINNIMTTIFTCLVSASGQGAAPSSDFIVLIILFSLFSCQPSEMILVFFSFHSECEIVHHGDACTFMLLIHQWQSLRTGLCVFFLCCV